MNITESRLRDILHERVDVDVVSPPDRPAAVHGRIRRIRRRRAATGGVAVAATVALVLTAVFSAGTPHRPAPATPAPPAAFTQPDGTVYRLLQVSSFDSGRPADATAPLATHGGGISARVLCRTTNTDDTAAQLDIGGRYDALVSPCDQDGAVPRWGAPVDIPGTPTTPSTVRVNFGLDGGPSPRPGAVWTFAFYEWFGAGTAAPPAPALPGHVPAIAWRNGTHPGTLAGHGSFAWPGQESPTLTVPLSGVPAQMAILVHWAGGMTGATGAIDVQIAVHGVADSSSGTISWSASSQDVDVEDITLPDGARSITVELHVITYTPQYAQRPTNFTFGFYTEDRHG